MKSHTENTNENKRESVSNNESKTSKSTNSTFQFVDNRPEAVAQRKMKGMLNNSIQNNQAIQLQKMVNNGSSETQQTIQKKENNTGLPENLKTGMENLSGMSMDDVKVHRNSAKPAQLQAHAYAQGTDIHLGPGQEKHLPHELGHVVQQKEGRVKPTMQMMGYTAVNDDAGLEAEADQMGNRAVSFGKTLTTQLKISNSPNNVVQRFKAVDSGNYALDKDESQEARAPFTRFDNKMSNVEGEGGPKGHAWKETKDDKPPLNVAMDDTLAINSSEGEPKEFYADNTVIANSNKALSGVKSPVRLVGAGNKITLGEKELTMVQPNLEGQEAPDKDNFAKLAFDICRDSAKEIMGGKISHAILNDGTGQKRVEVNTTDSTEVTGTHNLANYMKNGGEDMSLGSASEAMKGKDNPRVGKEYGTESREGGKAASAAEKLGVNEHAWSKVGQGYVTQSIFDEEGTKTNFASADIPTNQFVWGYHYSSVVAESLGGGDQVAMENYARKADIKTGRANLLTELKTKFSEKVKTLELKGGDDQQIGMILKFVHENLRVTEKEAIKAYNDMFKEMNGHVGEHWHFRMNGQEEGQSFHEQMADASFFVNPMTLSVANMAKEKMNVSFEEGSTALTMAANNNLKSIAQDVLGTISQGQTINRINLKGYASGWKGTGIGASAKGKTRAETVKAKLVELGVDAALINVDDSPGRDVNESNFKNRRVDIELS